MLEVRHETTSPLLFFPEQLVSRSNPSVNIRIFGNERWIRGLPVKKAEKVTDPARRRRRAESWSQVGSLAFCTPMPLFSCLRWQAVGRPYLVTFPTRVMAHFGVAHRG